MTNLPNCLNLISNHFTSHIDKLIMCDGNYKSYRFGANEERLRKKFIKNVNNLIIHILKSSDVSVDKVQILILFEVRYECLRLITIMPNCKLPTEYIQHFDSLYDNCVILSFLFEFAGFLLNIDVIRLLILLQKICPINQGSQHGTFSATRVSDCQNNILIFGILKLCKCRLQYLRYIRDLLFEWLYILLLQRLIYLLIDVFFYQFIIEIDFVDTISCHILQELLVAAQVQNLKLKIIPDFGWPEALYVKFVINLIFLL